ncbi:MAG: hypothetical protein AAFN93_11390 [Bacteroidota bacterium]
MSKKRTYRSYFSSGLSILSLLVFGFFNTSGFVISTPGAVLTQTELLVEQRNSGENDLVPGFEKCRVYFSKSSDNHSSSKAFTPEHLIIYNSLISVRFQSQSEKLNIFRVTPYSTQLRIIPENSNDPYKS